MCVAWVRGIGIYRLHEYFKSENVIFTFIIIIIIIIIIIVVIVI
jgi:hypothetical protein